MNTAKEEAVVSPMTKKHMILTILWSHKCRIKRPANMQPDPINSHPDKSLKKLSEEPFKYCKMKPTKNNSHPKYENPMVNLAVSSEFIEESLNDIQDNAPVSKKEQDMT
jgi:hypothetical protein